MTAASPNSFPSPLLTCRFDRAVVDPQGGERYLLVELDTPRRVGGSRAPLDLALVIDVSGSMSGGKLAAAKQAAESLARHLDPQDRLSLVTFASDVQVHFQAIPMNAVGVENACAAITRLVTRGSTNLVAGWLTGVALLDEATTSQRKRAVVVLSDGQANQGILHPAEIAELARQSGAKGLPTTCVGVGNDYSTVQLGAIAEGSGGRFHDAVGAEEILEVLLGELVEIGAIAMNGAALEIPLSPGFAYVPHWQAHSETHGAVLHCPIGTVGEGARRTLLLRVTVPPRAFGTEESVPVRLTWTDPDTGAARELCSEPALLRFADASRCEARSEDVLTITRLEVSAIRRDLADLNEDGRYERIEAFLVPRALEMARFASLQPEAAMLAESLQLEVREGGGPMESRRRKELHVLGWKGQKDEVDVRPSRQRQREEI